jgi:Protein of unknown function (DUF1329)
MMRLTSYMHSLRHRAALFVALTLLLLGAPRDIAAAEGPIAPGTVITLQNWQQYKQFMPAGMQALFAGTYFWKMPADFKMVIGPTSHYPLSEAYLENTRKYSGQVKIKELPNGEHTVTGYVAGQPFPNPADPMKGYKILVNTWFRYVPHLYCGSDVRRYLKDRYGNVIGSRLVIVSRRLSHISAKGQPIDDPRTQGIHYTEFGMTLEPEQEKYTEILTIYYTDPVKLESQFIFSPQLRRVIRGSSNSRCAPVNGSDFNLDDYNGFNGGIARFQADYLRDQQILTLVNADPKKYGDLSNYYPLLFPKPDIGKWEVRDTYVLDVRRVPSQRSGYCYGKQIVNVDKYSYLPLWKDSYDPKMKLLKIESAVKVAAPVGGAGVQFATGNVIEVIWDVEKSHVTAFITAGPSGKELVNGDQCRNLDGVNYDDIQQYSTPGGLTQVMR